MDGSVYRLVVDLGFKFSATQWYGLAIHPHLYLTDPLGFQGFRYCPSAILVLPKHMYT